MAFALIFHTYLLLPKFVWWVVTKWSTTAQIKFWSTVYYILLLQLLLLQHNNNSFLFSNKNKIKYVTESWKILSQALCKKPSKNDPTTLIFFVNNHNGRQSLFFKTSKISTVIFKVHEKYVVILFSPCRSRKLFSVAIIVSILHAQLYTTIYDDKTNTTL